MTLVVDPGCVLVPRLVGDVLVATGFLSYAGPFNQEYRDALLTSWQKEMRTRKIPNSKDLNVTGMLVDSATVGHSLRTLEQKPGYKGSFTI